MTRSEWAFAELDLRMAEDRRFPVEPMRGTSHWHDYARMKRDRAGRRKRMGYSRATADALVRWAASMEIGRAA